MWDVVVVLICERRGRVGMDVMVAKALIDSCKQTSGISAQNIVPRPAPPACALCKLPNAARIESKIVASKSTPLFPAVSGPALGLEFSSHRLPPMSRR